MSSLGPRNDGGPNIDFFHSTESMQGFETVRQWLQKNCKRVCVKRVRHSGIRYNEWDGLCALCHIEFHVRFTFHFSSIFCCLLNEIDGIYFDFSTSKVIRRPRSHWRNCSSNLFSIRRSAWAKMLPTHNQRDCQCDASWTSSRVVPSVRYFRICIALKPKKVCANWISV